MKGLILALLFIAPYAVNGQKIAKKKDKEVSITVEGGELKGSLLVPKGKQPKPVVLLIPGSGPTDRNCNSPMLRSNAFIYLAEGLYKEGIASLRVDKRFSGETAKTFDFKEMLNPKFDDLIQDAVKWVEFLKQDERFSKVIVLGHSQGSLVGMKAVELAGADQFISLAGPGRSIDDILYDQLSEGLPEIPAETTRQFLDSIKVGSYYTDAPKRLTMSFPQNLTRFLEEWMSYTPTSIISSLQCPVLIINGERDIQVGVEEARLLNEHVENAELVLIETMSHVLKEGPIDRTLNAMSYNAPDAPIHPELIPILAKFILNN